MRRAGHHERAAGPLGWQADIANFVSRVIVTGFAFAFAGAALRCHAHVIRLMK